MYYKINNYGRLYRGASLEKMASGSIVYDVAVIGAGVIGSAAAYQIAKNGSRVILLEQVRPFSRASSQDLNRVYVFKVALPDYPNIKKVVRQCHTHTHKHE